MNFSCALAVILMTSSVSAFSLGPSISPGLTKLFAFRQTYQYQLDEGTGKVNINGASFDTETASAQVDADLKESKVAGAEAMARFAALEAAVRAKEQQQREMALKMRDELQNQKAEFKKKVIEMGDEATYLKLDAHKEKMQTVDAFKAREKALQEEMAALSAKLMEEKEHVFQNQLVTNRILETRVALDAALGKLQKQLEQERKDWQTKLAAEKEAHNLEMQKLVEAQEARSREMMNYAEANRELESKLAAEQEAHLRDIEMYELAKEELGSKLSAEQDARSRDLKILSAEQDAFNRDLMKYEQVSKELAGKLVAEQDAHTRDLSMLTAEQEAHQRDLVTSQQQMTKAQEMTQVILGKRIALQQESNSLESKLKAEQNAHDRDLISSQKLLAQLQQEVLEMEKEKDVLKRSKEQADELYMKLSQAQEETNRIQQQRIEIDGELTRLQRQYNNDSKLWKEKMEREVAAQRKIADDANVELEKLKKKKADMEAERSDVGSLMRLTFEAMFGLKQ